MYLQIATRQFVHFHKNFLCDFLSYDTLWKKKPLEFPLNQNIKLRTDVLRNKTVMRDIFIKLHA